jgi:hypothetical protein
MIKDQYFNINDCNNLSFDFGEISNPTHDYYEYEQGQANIIVKSRLKKHAFSKCSILSFVNLALVISITGNRATLILTNSFPAFLTCVGYFNQFITALDLLNSEDQDCSLKDIYILPKLKNLKRTLNMLGNIRGIKFSICLILNCRAERKCIPIKNPPITHLSGKKPATIAPPSIMKYTQEKII